MLDELSPLRAAVLGIGLWVAGTAASTVAVTAIALALPQTCEHPGKTFPALYETLDDWEHWFNTPLGFTAASACMAASMLLAHIIGSRTVRTIAWVSLPLQATLWHRLLMLTDWCN